MPSPTYTLFRNAILAEQQVICSYGGRHRELCPLVLGTNKKGEEAVLAWQFAGESQQASFRNGGTWKCLGSPMSAMRAARDGRWYEGQSHRSEQTCVTNVDLDINIHVRKNRR